MVSLFRRLLLRSFAALCFYFLVPLYALGTSINFTSAPSVSETTGQIVTYQATTDQTVASYSYEWASSTPGGTVSLNASTGLLTLNLTTPGTYVLILAAYPPFPSSLTDGVLDLTVNVLDGATPVITSPTTVWTGQGAAMTYQVAASHSPTSYSLQWNNMPNGSVAFNPSTGLLSMTPSDQGSYVATITAVNASGASGSATVSFNVGPLPSVTSPTTVHATVGVMAFSTASATNSPTSYWYGGFDPYTIDLGQNGVDGSADFQSSTPGVYVGQLAVTNQYGTTTVPFTLIESLPSTVPVYTSTGGTTNVEEGQATTLDFSTTGATSYAFGWTQGTPQGQVQFNPSTGKMLFDPTVSGTFPYVVEASNASGAVASSGTIYVEPTFIFTSADSFTGTVGVPTTYTVATQSPPANGYTYSFPSVAVPGTIVWDQHAGTFTVTPTVAGTYQISFGTSGHFSAASKVVTLTVTGTSESPVMGGQTSLSAAFGQQTNYQITASNNPTSYSYQWVGTAPGPTQFGVYTPGLVSFEPNQTGTFQLQVTATNSGGSATATIPVVVPAVPGITSPSALTVLAGSPVNYQVATYNPATTYSYSVSSGSPTNVSFNSTTGMLTFTPATAGLYAFFVTASNGSGTSNAYVSFTAVANPAITSSSTFQAIGNDLNTYAISANFTAASYSGSWVGPACPGTVNLDSSSGLLSITPSALGTYTYEVAAARNSITASQNVTITVVAPAAPSITSPSVVHAVLNQPLSYQIAANSAVSYGFSWITACPGAEAFDGNSGILTLTPSQLGTYSFTASATNLGGTVSATVTVIVGDELPPVTPYEDSVTTFVGKPTTYTLPATNNPTQYTFAWSSLPSGSGQSFDPTTGTLTITPTVAGTFLANLTASNDAGTSTTSLTLTVNPSPGEPTISSTSSPWAIAGSPFTFAVQASASPSSYSFAWVGTPPAGNSTFDSTAGTLELASPAAGTYYFEASATNFAGTGTQFGTLTVYPDPTLTSAASVSESANSSFTYQVQPNVSASAYSWYWIGDAPAGSSFDPTTGLLTDTGSEAGTYEGYAQATTSAGTVGETVTFSVTGPTDGTPVISSSAALVIGAGQTCLYQIAASNSPTEYAYAWVGSSGGAVSCNPSTGLVSIAAGLVGDYTLALTASNGNGTGTLNVAVHVVQPAAITGPTTLTTSVGSSVVYQISTASEGAVYGYSWSGNQDPTENETFDSTAGTLSFTAAFPGTYHLTVTSTQGGVTSSQVVYVVIAGDEVFTSPAVIHTHINEYTTYQITTTAAGGNGYSQYSAGWVSNADMGSPISTSNYGGLVSFVAEAVGTFQLKLYASLSAGKSVGEEITGLVTVVVDDDPVPALSFPTFPTVSVGTAGTIQVTATNSPTSYSVAFAGAANGTVGIDSSGLITLTAIQSGYTLLAVTATNSNGSNTVPVNVYVGPSSLPAPAITSPTTASAVVGAGFTYTIIGTNSPTSYSLTSSATLPAGLTFNSATGVYSGTPTVSGTFVLALGASNGANTGTGTLTLTIAGPPTITSAAAISMVVGTTASYQVAASANPTSFSVTGSTPQLEVTNFNGETGALTLYGTAVGTHTLNLTASNGIGASAPFQLTVEVVAPTITSPIAVSGTIGSPLTYTVTTNPNLGGLGEVFALEDVTPRLPGAFSFSPSSGVLSMTPTATGTYQANVSVNSGGATVGELVTFTIVPAQIPAITSGSSVVGTVGQAFSYQTTASGGPTAFALSWVGTPCPGAANFDSTTGLLTLTPSLSGTYTFQVNASNSAGSGSQQVTLTVHGSEPVITSGTSLTTNVGVLASYQVAATNSPTSFSFEWLGEACPGTTAFDETTGLFSITPGPTGMGTYEFQVTATNGMGSTSADVTLDVGPALNKPVFTSSSTIDGIVDVPLSFQVQADDGPTSYGMQPVPGFTIDPTTGIISGTPSSAGSITVTLTATNSAGTTYQSARFVISTPPPIPAVTSATTLSAAVGQPFSYQVTATNGPTSFGFAWIGTAAPGTANFDTSSGLFTLTPTAPGTYAFTISATNGNGMGSEDVTLEVYAAPVFTSGSTLALPAGIPVTFQTIASNSPLSFSITDSSPGVSSSITDAGVLALTVGAPGTYHVTVQASNPGGVANQTITLNVGGGGQGVPVITSETQLTGVVGQNFYYQIAATNSPTGYLIGWNGTPAPGVGTMDTSSGFCQLTPSAAGTYTFTVYATNGAGTGQQDVTLTISDQTAAGTAPEIISSANWNAVLNETASYQVVATGAASSFTALWSGAACPGVVSGDPSTGYYTLNPTATGTYTFTITATNTYGTSSPLNVTLTVSDPVPPSITSPAVVNTRVGTPTNVSITATGNPTAYGATWVGSGCPGSVTFEPGTGVASITPTATGSYTFTASATNIYGTSLTNVTINVSD